jgi:hypothetical protein
MPTSDLEEHKRRAHDWRQDTAKLLATLLIAGNGAGLLTTINVAAAISSVSTSPPPSYPAWIFLGGVIACFFTIFLRGREVAQYLEYLDDDRDEKPDTMALGFMATTAGACFVAGSVSALLALWPI